MSSLAKSIVAAGLLCAAAGVAQSATRADVDALRADRAAKKSELPNKMAAAMA